MYTSTARAPWKRIGRAYPLPMWLMVRLSAHVWLLQMPPSSNPLTETFPYPSEWKQVKSTGWRWMQRPRVVCREQCKSEIYNTASTVACVPVLLSRPTRWHLIWMAYFASQATKRSWKIFRWMESHACDICCMASPYCRYSIAEARCHFTAMKGHIGLVCPKVTLRLWLMAGGANQCLIHAMLCYFDYRWKLACLAKSGTFTCWTLVLMFNVECPLSLLNKEIKLFAMLTSLYSLERLHYNTIGAITVRWPIGVCSTSGSHWLTFRPCRRSQSTPSPWG